MLQSLFNIFKIPDLKKKVLITLGLIAVYRIGAFIPTPGIDSAKLMQFFENIAQTSGGTLFGLFNVFSGGAMQRATIFALGIMPYISASIILQLLTAVIPRSSQDYAIYEIWNCSTGYSTIIFYCYVARKPCAFSGRDHSSPWRLGV
jgi:preprotein translocase subunit SecY